MRCCAGMSDSNLQATHSAGVLLWLDAHGDCKPPRTTRWGMLGGMPVAVCAGLAHPNWRERSQIVMPMPTDRILMVDVRDLDPHGSTNRGGLPISGNRQCFVRARPRRYSHNQQLQFARASRAILQDGAIRDEER
jgi:hypothetical protein